MANRIISAAMWAVMVFLGLGSAVSLLEITRAERINSPLSVVHHLHGMTVDLAALVVVASLYSVMKRLAAIEARLKDR